MPSLPHLRLLDDSAASGKWNMAVDEVLLQSAIDGIATLRWYTWREPTISMGYFQRESDLDGDPRLAGLPRVRRLTGGGTLVHDQELTYSLALPPSQRLFTFPVDLYRLVHEVVAGVLQARGVPTGMRGVTVKRADEPVLCFAREDEHDLVLMGHKILGSAQRRRRGAILQHGGLLLKASTRTPELPGITDLCPRADLSELSEDLRNTLHRQLARTAQIASLTLEEVEAARELAGE